MLRTLILSRLFLIGATMLQPLLCDCVTRDMFIDLRGVSDEPQLTSIQVAGPPS